ncbi:MAG: hypothetical protein KAI26_00450 [Nanoarchaeota archaeon]|nr:hypothetical protein [Nanoarchaeota archaeon]
MKKIVILLVFLAVLIMGVFNVHAKSENSAVIINDVWCGLVMPNEDGNLNQLFTLESHIVKTNSKNNNVLLTCRGQVPEVHFVPKSTTHLNHDNTGFMCYTSYGKTSNWKLIITPSGHVKLTCHYKDTTE